MKPSARLCRCLTELRRPRHGLALLCGLFLPLAFAPVGFWPVAVLCCTGLLWLWQNQSPGQAAWRGFLFGLGAFGAGVSWVYISLHSYGGAPLLFAALTNLLLILYLSLYPALVGWLTARFTLEGPLRWLLVAPALWGLGEWLRGLLLSGFPWLAVGYSQIDGPLAGLAPVLGVFGVGWAVWLSAGLLLALIHARGRGRYVWVAGLAVLWLGGLALGRVDWTRPVGEPLGVALVQGNIAQERKWRPEYLDHTLNTYVRLSLEHEAGADLIVWPESAVPVLYQDIEAEFFRPLQARAADTGTDYLLGMLSGDWETRVFHNGVVQIGSDPGFYFKDHLLPFGEYLPLRGLLAFFNDWVDIPMSDFQPGGAEQTLLTVQGVPVGVSICFEAAFGNEIIRALPKAGFLVNVSNDAWFGRSLAPYQHLEINRLRALETGRPLVRATNTGVSALLDHKGRIVARSRLQETAVVTGRVQPRQGATPYVRLGDGLILGVLGLALGLGMVLGYRENG